MPSDVLAPARRPSALRAAAALVALALGTEALLALAPLARGPLTFDVGPSTGRYGTGLSGSEERPPSTFRWTTSHAGIAAPLFLSGSGATLAIRAARFVDEPTNVHVSVAGRPAGVFRARPGGFKVHRLALPDLDGPAWFDLLSDDPRLGVALDWLRIEDARVRVPLAHWRLRLLAPGTAIAATLAGMAPAAALLAGAVVGVAVAAAAALDPFALAHVSTRIALPAVALTMGAAVLVRGRPRRQVVVLAFLASYLLKGWALFHPSYFYNDVRNNLRYVAALRDDGRPLAVRNRDAQVKVGVAYPRVVAGRKYAFPYSPVFFLPFTPLHDDAVVESIKQVALAAAAAETVVVFLLAGLALGPGAGSAAAVLAAVLPPLHSRLALAMWSTVAGHFLDTLVLLALVAIAARGATRARLGLLFSAVAAALLTYVSSLFNLTLLLLAHAAMVRRHVLAMLATLVAATGLTVAVLYRDFALTFFREIVPALVAGGAPGGGARMGLLESVSLALSRIPLFFGLGHTLLALAGLLVVRGQARPEVWRTLLAAAAALAGLIALRGLSMGLFKDLKEVEFASPLVAFFAGATLEALAARGPRERRAAVLLAVGLVAFSLGKDAGYFSEHTSLAGLP